jgi:microcystin-dependent protein
MAIPYIGEIRLFAGNFEPVTWLFCDGRTLPISEYETLFALVGTTYGGDGSSTFNLPDMRGRVPVHQNGSHPMGETFGVERVTLGANNLPPHTHVVSTTSAAAGLGTPAGALFASTSVNSYSSDSPTIEMHPAAVGSAGGSQPHSNMAPSLALNYIICYAGIFPSRS